MFCPASFIAAARKRKQFCGFDFRSHVGKLPLDCLKFADGLAKLPTLFGIFQRRFIGALGHAQRQRCDGDAATIQHAHGVDESAAFFPQQIFRGKSTIFKDEFSSIAGAQVPACFLFCRDENPSFPSPR